MCDPLTTGLIISGIGTGAGAVNTNRTLRRQDRQAARGIEQQSAKQREANQRVRDQIASLEGDTGEADRAASLEDFRNALRADKTSTEAGLDNTLGIGGERFVQRAGAGKEQLNTAGQSMAERLATISGTLRQRQREGSEFGRLGVDLTALSNDAAAADYLTRLRIANERNNPFIDAGAGLLQGYGEALSQRVPKTPKTPKTRIGRGN